jgi:hypothetical protein
MKKEPRKQKLWRRAYMYDEYVERPYPNEVAAFGWVDGYKACMTDLRKLLAEAARSEPIRISVIRDFLKPMR